MELIWAVLAAVLPAIGWIAICYWWDRSEPEPPLLIAKLFLSGMILGFVITALLVVLQTIFVTSGTLLPFNALTDKDGIGQIFIASMFIATIYECSKLWLARKLVVHEKAFSQVVDGIVYFSTVALGAALMENIIFLTNSSTYAFDLQHNLLPLVFRFVFNSIISGVCAGIVGFGIGNVYKKSYHNGGVKETSLTVSWKHPEIMEGLIIAILLHTSYLIFVYLNEPRVAGSIAIIGAFYLFTRFASHALTMNIQE